MATQTARTFVTNDELRTCLSQDAVVPWFESGSYPSVPRRLVAFDGPVDPATLDALRPRGTNSYWVGLELDARERPAAEPLPAPLDAIVPMSSVRKIVFANSAELGQFEATKLANVHLPPELVVVDSAWFSPTAPAGTSSVMAPREIEEASAATAARVDRFRRLHGAAVAAMGWPKAPSDFDPFLIGIVHHRAASTADFRVTAGPLVADVLAVEGVTGDDPASEAWAAAAGVSVAPKTSPLERVDQRVREAVVEHVLSTRSQALDREALTRTILAAAAEAARVDEHSAAAERYPKAVDVGLRIWRNVTTWERLLDKWPDGFQTLLAALLMGSVHDADQYVVLAARVRNLPLPSGVARLALALYGLRWGIEAVPTGYRAPVEKRRLSEAFAWHAVDRVPESPPAAPLKASWALERKAGRAGTRPYTLRLDVLDQRFEWTVEPAKVIAAKLRRALERRPDALRNALIPLAATLSAARPYLGWTVRLPKSGAYIELDRGRATLAGPLSDGEPTIERRWTDWDGFVATLARRNGPLGELTRASDLSAWERVIEDADAGTQSES